MNTEIARTQRQVIDLYERQRAYLAAKPRQFVEDLQHEAQELRFSNIFSVQTAAEINYTAATMTLETATTKENPPSPHEVGRGPG
ncbi:MAG: hypothetical protein KGL39_13195 [Patescibacteria group bacterium]|nr:hypothetical protein [Patescibacteria group bacterium]